MSLLVLALLAFALVHLVPAIPRAKNYWVQILGRGFGPAYGVASLLLLIGCIAAFRQSEFSQFYTPPAWGRYANFVLTLFAFAFLGIFLFRGSWRNRIRFPMAVAIGLWALGHLLANGETRGILLFAGLAFLAAVHAFLVSRLYDFQPEEERKGHNLLSILFGIALYGVMTQLHGALIGVPVIEIAGFAK